MMVINGIFASFARVTTAILLCATGAVYSERAGFSNIILEGAMLMGTFVAVAGSYFSGSPSLALLYTILFGALLGVIYAAVVLHLHGNAIVVGIAINLLAIGMTTFLLPVIYGVSGSIVSDRIIGLSKYTIPLLNKIPGIGGMFTKQTLLTYFSWIFVFFTQFVLYNTKFGMNLRACGENPSAAQTVGVNVTMIRYLGSIITAVCCTLAGAQMSLGLLSLFSEEMTGGRGFIALAAVTFAKANPKRVMLICFLFGICEAISNQLQIYEFPPQIINMLPYLAVIVFLIFDSLIARSKSKQKKLKQVTVS